MSHHPDIGDPEANYLGTLKMNQALEEQKKRREEQEARDKEQAEWDAKYPQHSKLREVKKESQIIGEFLDWATNEQGWDFYYVDDDKPVRAAGRLEDYLAEYFDIDQVELSNEKDRMLDEHRKKNNL